MNVDSRGSLVFALACASFAGVLSLSVDRARAYSTPDAFAERPEAGGGGNRWFSGSPADGYSCNVCHSSAAGQRQFPMYVTGLPLEGYELAEAREVVLSWPELSRRWREIKPDPMQPSLPGAPLPAGVVFAEVVAEWG